MKIEIRADRTPKPELVRISNSHELESDSPAINSGSAEPIVNPQMRSPMASPFPRGNHVEMNWTATGYIPAKNIPVRNLKMNARRM